MTGALLQVRQLKKYFPITGGLFGRTRGQVYAVDGVDFAVRAGETLGIVGESGCGKSTLGRTVLRLYEPTAGQIIFDGQDITKTTGQSLRATRRQMQMIFQDPFSSLNPRMTVGGILAEPFRIHENLTTGELAKKVAFLLGLVGLPTDAQNRYPHEFSGGQRQRIGIARAIALQPKMIIADEPVSALDVSIQSQILNLLADLKDKFNLSYTFIAHDLAVIEHISDTVAVMYLGRIVEYTSAANLFAGAKHPYTKALIAAIPKPQVSLHKKREILGGDVPSPISPPSGCHFHPRCPMAAAKCSVDAPQLRNLGSEKNPQWVACHYA